MASTTTKEVPRSLTAVEIEDIVSVIPPVQAASVAVAKHNHEEIVKTVRLQLTEVKLRPSKIPELKARIFNRCRRADINPGETVGLHAAEAIGQPITQATLDTFHKSGDAVAGNIGVHVFAELLNLTQNRKMSLAFIHLKDPELSATDAICASRAFTAVSVKSLLEDPISGISFMESSSVKGERRPTFYRLYEIFYSTKCPDPDRSPVFMRLLLNTSRLFATRITTAEVAAAIEEAGGVTCVFSPTYQGIIDIYPEAVSVVEYLSKQEKLAESAIAAAKQKKKKVYDDETMGLGLTPENSGFIFLQMFVAPRIINESLLVGSSLANKSLVDALKLRGTSSSLGDEEGEEQEIHVPPQSSSLALFKTVSFLQTKVTDIVRGATPGERPGEWNLWFDCQKETSICVPRERLEILLEEVYGVGCVVSKSSEKFVVKTSSVNSPEPISTLNKLLSEEKTRYDAAVKKSIDESPLSPLPKRPEIVKKGFYVFLKGMSAIAPSLKRLVIHPAINQRATITNNPHEISAVRGIEAARAWVFKELHDLVVATGSTINPRHVQIIVDVMISSGTLMPFTARGSVRQQLGAYSESSFEQALQAFLRSAVVGAPEPVSATSTSILVGKQCEFGTGTFRLIPSATLSSSQSQQKSTIPAPIPISSITSSVLRGGVAEAAASDFISSAKNTGEASGVSAEEATAFMDPVVVPPLSPSSRRRAAVVEQEEQILPSLSHDGFGSLSFPPQQVEDNQITRFVKEQVFRTSLATDPLPKI